MRVIDEQPHLATAGTLYSDTHGRAAGGGGADRRGRGEGLSRLLRGAAARVAAFWQRRAGFKQLSEMSDRELADIGLNRAQAHCVFDPEFARARGTEPRAVSDLEERMLADLGPSRTLPRPTASD